LKHPEKASESILHISSIEMKVKIFPFRLKAARYFVGRLSHTASKLHTDRPASTQLMESIEFPAAIPYT
jgi:hypothetical protein